MARYLDRLGQIAAAANTVAEYTRSTLVNRFPAAVGLHLYLHTADADVRFFRHDAHEIIITAHLQPPFAWRIASEQDDAGVYYVALRKAVVGAVASGRFEVVAPHDVHTILKLEGVRLTLDSVTDTLDLPGQGA